MTSGESGILSGNQTGVDAQAPVNLSGNQVTVIGQDNTTTSSGDASTGPAGSGGPTTSGEDGIGSGNQTAADVQAPVNATGNQVTVIGQDNTVDSTGGSETGTADAGPTSAAGTTSGESGILAGNQTGIDLQAPINATGNQVTVIGQDNETGATGSASTGDPSTGSTDGATTSGEGGLVSGNQTGIGVALPIDLSGNQVTVIGQDNTVSTTGDAAAGDTGGDAGSAGATTSGEDGLLSGNQTAVGVAIPVDAAGNQVTVIGQENTVDSTGGSSTGGSSTGPGSTTTGEGGVGSGNQTPVAVQVPVDTSGNQVTVIGQGNTVDSTSGSTTTPGGTTPPGDGNPVVSPPSDGPVTTGGGQGGATPGTTVLPNTGVSGGLLGLGLLGLLALLLGTALCGRRRAIM